MGPPPTLGTENRRRPRARGDPLWVETKMGCRFRGGDAGLSFGWAGRRPMGTRNDSVGAFSHRFYRPGMSRLRLFEWFFRIQR